MSKTLCQVLLWEPRGLATLFILFISLFALDVFEMGLGFWGTLAALIIHLVLDELGLPKTGERVISYGFAALGEFHSK